MSTRRTAVFYRRTKLLEPRFEPKSRFETLRIKSHRRPIAEPAADITEVEGPSLQLAVRFHWPKSR